MERFRSSNACVSALPGHYAVDGNDTAKVLADALGYDHDHGRVARVGRGVYAPTGSPPPRVMRLLDF